MTINTTVRDDYYHQDTFDARTPKKRQAERDAIDAKVDEFLRNGGRIEQISQPTMVEIKSTFHLHNGGTVSDKNRQNAQKHKHEYLLNKEIAIENGQDTYFGPKCKTCGGYERGTKRGNCIACYPNVSPSEKTKAMYARKAASQANEETYTGTPCSVCGCATRTTVTGACTEIWKHSAIKRNEREACKAQREAAHV